MIKSAVGHGRLLWSRRPISEVIGDSGSPRGLKSRLGLVLEARAFGFAALRLKKTRDFSTFAQVPGSAVTYLVSACPKTRFEPYRWWFPVAGSFPYKGYFDREDARREKERLERRDFDAVVLGAEAYNTPLWVSDPLPSSALGGSPGALVALILHELAHGTLFFKGRLEFDESLATFVGEQGALEFLASRFGPDSPELLDYRAELVESAERARRWEALYARLDALYRGSASDSEKLARRKEIFSEGRAQLRELGTDPGELNNAAVLARRLYTGGVADFRALYESGGKEWAWFWAELKSLDRRRPEAALKSRLARPRASAP